MHWMLFKKEATGDHYLWNGIRPICVSADEQPVLRELTEKEIELLTTSASTPRTRTLTFRKTRYAIIAKGKYTDV
jgi:hypothetical protein